MKSKMLFSLVLLLTVIALAGCGGRDGKVLLVGVPEGEDSVFFNTDQAIKEPDSILEFKGLIDKTASERIKELLPLG